jgi:hypothetical protein
LQELHDPLPHEEQPKMNRQRFSTPLMPKADSFS